MLTCHFRLSSWEVVNMAASQENPSGESLEFTVNKKIHEVSLRQDSLSWKPRGAKDDKTCTVKLGDIFQVESGDNSGTYSVTVHYVDKTKNPTWKQGKLVLTSSDQAVCNTISEKLKQANTDHPTRPKSVLIFVNPGSGGCKGLKLLTSMVEPLLKLADIKTDVIITKDENHAHEVIQSYDMTQIDCLLCIGGDGTFRQVINALVVRNETDSGRDLTDPDNEWSQPTHRVGLIPAGTGQGVVYYLTGTYDAMTAALHFVAGTQCDCNLMSVYNGGKHLSMSALLVGHGLFGRIIRYAESNRWMGRARYIPAMMKFFFGSQIPVTATVSYLPIEDEKSTSSAPPSDREDSSASKDIEGWVVAKEGQILSVFASGSFSPHQGAEMCRFYLFDHPCPRMEMFKFMKEAASDGPVPPLGHIKEYIARAVKISEPGDCTNRWLNIDGDPFELTDPLTEIRYLPKLLKVFGTGPQRNATAEISAQQ